MVRPFPSLLSHKGFAAYWVAYVCSGMSFQMVSTALAWQIYTRTARASDLGLIGLVQFLPAVLLALPAGRMADRHSRRLLVVFSQMIACAAVVGLLIQSVRGDSNTFHLFAFVGIIGIALAIRGPSFQSMVPGLVSVETLPRAMAATAMAGEISVVCGPVLGGLLYLASPAAVYLSAAGLFMLSMLLMMRLNYTQIPTRKAPGSREELFAGFHFIRKRPDILAVTSLDLFAVLLGGATALLPIFSRDILHTGAWGLGLLRTAPSVGSILVGIWLARRPLERHVGILMFACVAGFGVATIAFALSTHLVTSLLALVFLGGFDMVSMVIRGALVQLETPDGMRGRVNAVTGIFVNTSNQLGQFESGMLAALIGAVPAIAAGGLGTLVVTALWMRWFPSLRRRQTLDNSPDTVVWDA